MNIPLISVLVPVYNVEKYLRECLDSIINQTLKDIEIICINDGSTDNSLSILEEYALKDDRIIVMNKSNTGYGNTMNVGLGRAIGEYIGIVESDDFVAINMFEKLYSAAKYNEAEVVKSNYIAYKNSSGVEKEFIEILKECRYSCIYSPIKEEQNIFFVPPSIWSGIYKREFLVKNGICFNETPGASYQDTSFAFKVLASAERVFLIKDAFLHYRIDNMNSSVLSPEKIFCVCDEYEEIEKFIEINPIKKNELKGIEFSMKYRTYKWNYNRLVSAFQYAFLMRMSQELKQDYKEGFFSNKYWNENEYEELQLIINEPQKYFKATAKDYQDDRLMVLSTLNLQFYINGFIDCIGKYDKIIVYGAGIIGKKTAGELINKGKEIFCFAVSDVCKNSESVLDINIRCIDDLVDYSNNSVILVAVKEKDQYDIINKLKTLEFKNIISIDSLILNGLSGNK